MKRAHSPQGMIASGFLSAILAGGLLLMLPCAVSEGAAPLSFSEAFFTATSATCVTGLSVIDVGARLSLFGQIVLLAMIQLGGLGITAFGTFFLVLVGRRLSIQSEFALMDAYGMEKVDGLKGLLCWTVGLTALFELAGAGLLCTRYLHPVSPELAPFPPGRAFYYALFHSVSAFCNAGFSLHARNLADFANDPVYLNVVGCLIAAGGLGFLVLFNLITIKFWRRNLKTRGRISLHSRVVLSTTVILITLGGLVFLAAEWRHSLAALAVPDKISCAFFQSVTARTAGFNAVDMTAVTELSRLATSALMLVGGSPGSAAGGIKTTTLVVLLTTVVSMCSNRRETVMFSRTVPYAVVREAIVIVLLAVALVFTAFAALLCTEAPILPGEASRLLFETISASATAGLSIDTTGTLSECGRWVIILCMYMGRLGPLAVAFMIGNREESLQIRYPEEEIVVG